MSFIRHSVFTDILSLAILMIVAVAIVNPIGDFPLNDDWSYGQTVKTLMDEGVFRPAGWTRMTLFSQAVWGALFSLPFGFSYNSLRISTLVLGLAGVITTYLLLGCLGAPRWVAWIGGLILAFNPIYFSLSYTFMTDVPFTAFSLLSIYFFVKYLQVGSDRRLAFGTGFAILAILDRQIGIIIPLAFTLAYLAQCGLTRRNLLRGALPLILCLVTWLGFEGWMRFKQVLPDNYGEYILLLSDAWKTPRAFLLNFINNIFTCIHYLGLFLFPFVLINPNPFRYLKSRLTIAVASIAAFVFVFASVRMVVQGRFMPIGYNVLIEGGVGPLTLHDEYILILRHYAKLPELFWLFVTVISIISGVFLIGHLSLAVLTLFASVKEKRWNTDSTIILFLLLSIGFYLAPILLTILGDNYYLLALPTACCAIYLSSYRKRRLPNHRLVIIAAYTWLAFSLLYSITATHDYLAWNRLRWQALNKLTEQSGIQANRIDGGFEFNGMFLYRPDYETAYPKSWWWVEDDEFIISMGAVEGYHVLEEYSYQRWLPPQRQSIFILRRN